MVKGCVVNGDVTGTGSGFTRVGGIVGGCILGTIQNCTYQGGTVTGNDDVGGIVGTGNARLIENCVSRGSVRGNERVGGIVGETCGPIRGCENYGAVSGKSYTGGITGHTFSGKGLTGTVENCKNYGSVTAEIDNVGGIVGWAEYPVRNCENHGRIEGYEYVGGIAGDAEDAANSVTGCTNDGMIIGQLHVGSIVGGIGGGAVILYPNGAPGTSISMVRTSDYMAVPECPFSHPSIYFYAWNTKADGTGTWYHEGDVLGKNVQALYAVWMDRTGAYYETPDGEWEYEYPYYLRSEVLGLPTGWYMAEGDVTFSGRLIINGDVNLILGLGRTITCSAGISVPPESSLTIWAGDLGAGTLVANGAAQGAGIGGDKGKTNGPITINGGTVTASGNFGAGIGGGDQAAGGIVTINGGTVTATGGSGSAGIGGGGYGDGGTVTINGGTVTATGSAYSDTNQAAAGIGAGRPRLDGSQPLNGGSVTINGGVVRATAGDGGYDGIWANAIGANSQHSSPGTLTIAKGMQAMFPIAYPGPAMPSDFANREATCRMSVVWVEPCRGHRYQDAACRYCGVFMTLGSYFAGSGQESTPFLIESEADWNKLAELYANGELSNGGFWYRLNDDISVTTMLGTADHPFNAKFDGGGHTLTFTAENPDNDTRVAPFAYVNRATIRNLHTAGSVTGSYDRASGLVGENTGNTLIQNCRVSMTLSGRSFVSGLCIGNGGTLTIEGCVFDGSITAVRSTAGLVGWAGSGLTIKNSLFAPSSAAGTGSAIYTLYYPNETDDQTVLENAYWLKQFGTAQGGQALQITGDAGVTVGLAGEGTQYQTAGITAYPVGIRRGGALYAGPEETVSLALSTTAPFGEYYANAGTLARDGEAWDLAMPASGSARVGIRTLEGQGTAAAPLEIASVNDWGVFCGGIEQGFPTGALRFLLKNGIAVASMAGTRDDPFQGTFDGGGQTLTFTAVNDDDDVPYAPFAYIAGATIENLRTAGSITGRRDRAAGLVGENVRSTVAVVRNCRVSMTLSGKNLIGGFFVGTGAGANLEGCVFDGTISAAGQSGGFVAWADRGLDMRACVFDPAYASGSGDSVRPFFYNGGGSYAGVIVDSVWLTPYGTAQGSRGYPVTGDAGVTVSLDAQTALYGVSGIARGYPSGLSYGGTVRAGAGDRVRLRMTAADWDGYENAFAASAGTLEQNGNIWTLTAQEGGAVISVRRTPTFTTAPLVRLKAQGGTAGYGEHGPENLFDGRAGTKWYAPFSGEAHAEFRSAFPVKPSAYFMTAADDAAANPGRNPASWRLLGKLNPEDEWTVLAEEEESDRVPRENGRDAFFPLTGDAAFQYFRLEITGVSDGAALQLAGLGIAGTPDSVPAFGKADFTLPAFLTTVGENAFAGIAAESVYIPDDCARLGDGAFRACPNLARVRVPAGCALSGDVFDGSMLILVYGAPGSGAETYCETHENCFFVPEE